MGAGYHHLPPPPGDSTRTYYEVRVAREHTPGEGLGPPVDGRQGVLWRSGRANLRGVLCRDVAGDGSETDRYFSESRGRWGGPGRYLAEQHSTTELEEICEADANSLVGEMTRAGYRHLPPPPPLGGGGRARYYEVRDRLGHLRGVLIRTTVIGGAGGDQFFSAAGVGRWTRPSSDVSGREDLSLQEITEADADRLVGRIKHAASEEQHS